MLVYGSAEFIYTEKKVLCCLCVSSLTRAQRAAGVITKTKEGDAADAQTLCLLNLFMTCINDVKEPRQLKTQYFGDMCQLSCAYVDTRIIGVFFCLARVSECDNDRENGKRLNCCSWG